MYETEQSSFQESPVCTYMIWCGVALQKLKTNILLQSKGGQSFTLIR